MSGTIICAPALPASNYSRKLLAIELDFDSCTFFTWFERNWQLCYYFGAAYLTAITVGRQVMRHRPAFRLRGLMFLWNLLLAAYSIMATWRIVPTMLYAVRNYGFRASACSFVNEQHRQAVAFWLFLFTVSKIVEFGDTVFIVLRKTRLVFLHWYHHLATALLVWSCGAYLSPMHIYFMLLNVGVHSVMYPYFALAALGVRLPVAVRATITALQLLQMLAGIVLVGYMYRMKALGMPCVVTDEAIFYAVVVYASYFVLFLNFFVKSYLGHKKPRFHGQLNGKKFH